MAQQRPNFYIGHKAEPGNLVPPHMFLPSDHNMDQGNQHRFFSTWPGLTTKLITKHLPPSVNTALDHLRQQYQNTRSTRIKEVPLPPPNIKQKTNNAFICFKPTSTIFSDQTGAFPVISSCGYRYIMFVYVYDINAILMRCLRTKAGAEHLQTFKDVHALLLRRGIQPKYCRMDNGLV